MNPKISVIVPVYKTEEYIYRCIDSILYQTFADFECILVDDHSPGICPQICDEYAKKDSRIKVIHNKNNTGSSLSRKIGFEHSSGDYIQFIDSDDWLEPNMLEMLYAAAIGENADIVMCDYYRNHQNDYYYEMQTIDTENKFNNLGLIHWCAVWNKFFHRKIISRIKFPVSSKYEDRYITQQAYFYAEKIVKIRYPLYHYFTNNHSSINEDIYKKYLGWRENILLTVNFLQENLKDKFFLIEGNINDNINRFKLKVIRNKLLFKDSSLLFFYPKSKFFRWIFLRLLKESLKMIVPYNLYIFFLKQGNIK